MDARAADDRHPLGYRPHDGGSAGGFGETRRFQKFSESSGRRLRTRPPRVATRITRYRATAAAGLPRAGGIVCGSVHPDATLETYHPAVARRAISRRHHHLPDILGIDSGLAPAAGVVVMECAGL